MRVRFELRAIVWSTKNVPPFDGDPSTKTDMFFRLWLSTLPAKESDTHYRCATGAGSFNWRFKFDLTLPVEGEGLREVGAVRARGGLESYRAALRSERER